MAERKAARVFVKFTNASATRESTLPLTVINQLQTLFLLVETNVFKSKAIHRHKPTNTAAKTQPTNVIFFQSEPKREVQVTFVVELNDSRLTCIFFFAEMGDIPQSDPCLNKILFGNCSDIILQSFLVKTALIALYAFSISKLRGRSSNHDTS